MFGHKWGQWEVELREIVWGQPTEFVCRKCSRCFRKEREYDDLTDEQWNASRCYEPTFRKAALLADKGKLAE